MLIRESGISISSLFRNILPPVFTRVNRVDEHKRWSLDTSANPEPTRKPLAAGGRESRSKG